ARGRALVRAAGQVGRCGPDVAGLCQSRHVRQLCAPRPRVRGRRGRAGGRTWSVAGGRGVMASPALPPLQRLKAMLGLGGSEPLPVRLSNRRYQGMQQAPVSELGFDQPLLWVVVALVSWGLVMVYSASIALPDNPRFANYAQIHFVLRHGLAAAMGFLCALAVFQFPMRFWERMAPWLFALSLVLL